MFYLCRLLITWSKHVTRICVMKYLVQWELSCAYTGNSYHHVRSRCKFYNIYIDLNQFWQNHFYWVDLVCHKNIKHFKVHFAYKTSNHCFCKHYSLLILIQWERNFILTSASISSHWIHLMLECVYYMISLDVIISLFMIICASDLNNTLMSI